jgi:KaiC/GvpD/RAD55 family RecA-like ATPase
LFESLTSKPLPEGAQILVEYEPDSQWYNASFKIVEDWLKSGGTVTYVAFAQPPDEVRSRLTNLIPNLADLERSEDFLVLDCYSATLGQKSKEKNAYNSLKIADLSIVFLQQEMQAPQAPEHLVIADDESGFARFNDERAWVEFELTRVIPAMKARKITSLAAVMRGIHSESVYKRLEGGNDAVIDFKLDDTTDPPRNLMRIRSLRTAGFDARWHLLNIADNMKVTLEGPS